MLLVCSLWIKQVINWFEILILQRSTAPAKNLTLCLIQNANEAVWMFAYLNLDYSQHFWQRLTQIWKPRLQAAEFWIDAVSTGGCALCLCTRRYVCVCVCMHVYGGVSEKKKLIYHNMLWNLPGVSSLSKCSLMKKASEPIGANFQWGGPNS